MSRLPLCLPLAATLRSSLAYARVSFAHPSPTLESPSYSNSIAIAFVFEVDDMLFAATVSSAARKRYLEAPPLPSSPAATRGSDGVAHLYAWPLWAFNLAFCIPEYLLAELPGIGPQIRNAWRLVGPTNMQTYVRVALLMEWRAYVFAFAQLHIGVHALWPTWRVNARVLWSTWRGHPQAEPSAKSTTRLCMEMTADVVKLGALWMLCAYSGKVATALLKLLTLYLGHDGYFVEGAWPPMSNCLDSYQLSQHCVSHSFGHDYLGFLAAQCRDGLGLGRTSWDTCLRALGQTDLVEWWGALTRNTGGGIFSVF
jgi:hypothetical protein